MQFSRIAFVAAMAAPALAQTADLSLLAQLPACALGPASSALAGSSCGTDIGCACNDPAFISGLQTTISTACSAADVQTALTVATKLCASAGVTLQVPGGSSSVSTSAAVSSTSTLTNTRTSVTTVVPTTATLISTSKASNVTSSGTGIPIISTTTKGGNNTVTTGNPTGTQTVLPTGTQTVLPTGTQTGGGGGGGTTPVPTTSRPVVTGAAASVKGQVAAGLLGVAGFLAFL